MGITIVYLIEVMVSNGASFKLDPSPTHIGSAPERPWGPLRRSEVV